MAERLSIVKMEPAVVLDWWSALGAGHDALRTQYPHARIEMVEPTEALAVRSARAGRSPWWSPRRWKAPPPVWTEATLPPGPRAQLLWSNLMLHWVGDPSALFARWHQSMEIGGFVMFSTFGPDTLKELQRVYQRLGWGPAGQSFIDMHDLGDALVHAGFADPVMDMEPLTLTWAEAPALLTELRGLGGNAAAQRLPGLRTPRWHARLLAELQEALAGPDGRPGLSFEIVYGHAFKAAPRVRVAAEAHVPLDTLRAAARAAGKSERRDG